MTNSQRSRENRTAQRFNVDVQVQMKSPGAEKEIVCAARDISHRGIFLYTDSLLPEKSPIEFTMKLKTEGAPEEGVRVLCSGTVVRVESPVDGNVGMAATIDSYRFLHTKKGTA